MVHARLSRKQVRHLTAYVLIQNLFSPRLPLIVASSEKPLLLLDPT